MDFDPNSVKWQCCCCSLPSGMRILSASEFVLCTATAAVTIYHISQTPQDVTYFEVCLVGLLLFVAITCVLLIVGVQKHSPSLIYPSLVARGGVLLFLAVFGVSTIVSPHPHRYSSTTTVLQNNGKWEEPSSMSPQDEPNVALRLVLFVFLMLFVTVLVFYCAYLVVRLIHYEQSFSKLKQRRDSLIQAGMIDPDYPSRRASSA
ncbi:unnamed protein product [Caenorhabditis auriculariae]|uniref:DUF7027 domain-containing protein n=1 Tax=Caenorhabditis auriculariae TaxID=2777116 RepID=A0A8S1GPE7_9PELO|nr:unnamed protein product [Caenorhabditis auriculariae]